jgi:hypothetical protein
MRPRNPRAYPNPAWTNKLLARDWDALTRLVGPARMPQLESRAGSRLVAREYGSGVYGTVMPTRTPGLVLKITSDPTEAHVAAVAREMRPYPPGLVRYGHVVRLEGHREGRPLYALWREEADDVGEVIDPEGRAAHDLNEIRKAADPSFRMTYTPDNRTRSLQHIIDAANRYEGHTGYEDGGPGPGPLRRVELTLKGPPARAGFGLDVFVLFAQDLAAGREAPLVGKTLLYFASRGLILADVHPGNLGRVTRNGRRVVVITDPGNVAFLASDYDAVQPPKLGAAPKRRARAGSPTPRARASAAR